MGVKAKYLEYVSYIATGDIRAYKSVFKMPD